MKQSTVCGHIVARYNMRVTILAAFVGGLPMDLECTLDEGHEGNHQYRRDGRLAAEWSDDCIVCGSAIDDCMCCSDCGEYPCECEPDYDEDDCHCPLCRGYDTDPENNGTCEVCGSPAVFMEIETEEFYCAQCVREDAETIRRTA